jgi:hypothetical protein
LMICNSQITASSSYHSGIRTASDGDPHNHSQM